MSSSAATSSQVAAPVSAGDSDGALTRIRGAVGLRTLPLATICGAMPRVIRDLAAATGKDVDFVLSGGDTELDRVVLETLSEPLAHLLRNAVTHGVETPAERESAGKPRRGRIELRALTRGSIVEAAVADDGRGVSAATAAQAGSAGSLTDLLTRPGYSTAGEVSDTAGRGVGLDAVREHVRSFGGSLEIRSEPGRGTEVILLLPLALSLMDALIVERGAALFAVPLPSVTEVLTATGAASVQGQRTLTVRDRPLPLADLASLIGAAAPPLPERPPALVIKTAERTIAVACDALVGQQEIAVKPLGPLLAGAGAFLGAAVLGDGRIALLIDPHALVTSGNRDRGGLPGGTDADRPAAPTILVAEDSFTARELQRTILETAGYQVLTARDGREALDVLGREPEVALVVSDLDMPRVGGLELTRAIREDPARSSLPVIIVTAHGSQEDVRRGIEAGADAYMAKRSFDQHALLATVERLVGR
jgi:two-component system, chemotaxis family, sensor kinase CheA